VRGAGISGLGICAEIGAFQWLILVANAAAAAGWIKIVSDRTDPSRES